MEIDNDKTVTGTICWDKTQMLLQGCIDQIPTQQPKALCTLLPLSLSGLPRLFPAEERGLSACQQHRFITSGKKEKKSNTKNNRKSSLLLLTIFQQF